MIPAQKHTLKFAEKISSKANSLFSNLLSKHLPLSTSILNRAARRKISKLMKIRTALVKDGPWTIAIIIDATLHERSSRHIENCQKFNHGKGWMLGHQWTNIGILINGQYVPLPPIPFYTKNECKKRRLKYRTEHEKVAFFIKTLNLKDLLGPHSLDEIVVLLDSGYDSKAVQNAVLSRNIDFTVSIRSTRTIFFDKKNTPSVGSYFGDGRRPWKTIRLKVDSGKKKWRNHAIKQLEGELNGVFKKLTLICSKRSDGKIKYLACSNVTVSNKVVLSIYQKRWAIETFHRTIKSYLGMEDAGSSKFDTLNSHVHWVYCAFILLNDFNDDDSIGIKMKQDILVSSIEISKIKKVVQKATRFNGAKEVKSYCYKVISNMEAMYGYC
jgi:hypothetical protein